MIEPIRTPAPETTAPRPQIPLLLAAVLLIYLGPMTLNPSIAPLSREVGLAEWQIGVTKQKDLEWALPRPLRRLPTR
ncbi:hypothetical protein ACT3TB_07945 [Micrococcaceae sp. AOP34-BR2-30]|uniref:Transporter, putative n=1 Tax=Microbacterium esteraromaticum TaxID=57043 RepID=A0A1R4KSE5_9MICO|nr:MULTISPECIES: hypothetical protein [Microbacterium]SJM43982.1 transporter, putative [Frigoribacterium sp. JB110]SJN47281.1 transporter, putative [Microbacterium esteraromaticum]